MIIESSKNPKYKSLLKLTKSKGIREQGQAIVSGQKITSELARVAAQNSFWVIDDKHKKPKQGRSEVLILKSELFKKLDVCGTHQPLLIVPTPGIQDYDKRSQNLATLYVALSDPTNLGALVRTCAAFGFPQIVLLKEAANPFLPKAIRASSGTCFATQFFKGPSIQDLRDPEIVALDMGGRKLDKSDLKDNLKLLVGEEGQGVPDNFLGRKLQIPISNKVESLNATIATSLLIYDWSRR